jgi:hypothetical protein
MSNSLVARGVIASLALVMSTGCQKTPATPSPAAPGPSTPTSPASLTLGTVFPTTGVIGDVLRVSGTGFVQGATLTVDGLAATVTFISGVSLRATVPAHAVGTVDVVVTTPDGQSATLSRAFTYDVVSLTVSPTVVAPGALLTVSWTAPQGRSTADWVGFFKVGDPNTAYDETRWRYTTGATGTVTFSAPSQQGEYEFRYLLDDGYVDAARSRAVTVR